jgi:serine-threonine kinase receptor-associated protein
VSYSPDGEIYATGSGKSNKQYLFIYFIYLFNLFIEDGTIRLWQTDPTKCYGLWQKNE